MGPVGSWLPVSGGSRNGGAVERISHMPSSGSLNHLPIKSDPSGVGKGREAVPGIVAGGVAGSSKWKRGSGNWVRVSEIRIAAGLTT